MPARNRSTNHYDTAHRRLREALLAQSVGKTCPHCGDPIQAGQPVDLDHTDDRLGYRGLAHASCNRRAGAIKTNTRRANPLGSRSRPW